MQSSHEFASVKIIVRVISDNLIATPAITILIFVYSVNRIVLKH